MEDTVTSTSESSPPLPNYTDTVKYYLDHRNLIQALKKKGKDIDLGRKIFALIYSKEMLKDPMVAIMDFQQEFLPQKQLIGDDDENILSHKMDMTTDLNTIVNTAEGVFNKGASITREEADHMAYLLLFLTAIPFAKDVDPNGQIVGGIESAFKDLTTKVFNCGSIGRNMKEWSGKIYGDQQHIFNTAADPSNEHSRQCMQAVKSGYDDFARSSGLTTSSGKMLQNDAKTEVNDQKVQLGGYSKMANMETSFMRDVNRGMTKTNQKS